MQVPTRSHGLDTLRAAAIVLVFAYHYQGFVSDKPTFGFLSDIGWVGVDLFFALSGYLIGNQIFAALRGGGAFSLKLFYARRMLRTLPNYFVVLALFFLWPALQTSKPMPPLWKFLTFTQNYLLEPGSAFSHAWSLCIEEQFYMVLPVLALGCAALRGSLRWAWVALAAVVVAGVALRANLWSSYVDGAANVGFVYHKYIYYSSFCRLDELVAGVALALLKNYHAPVWQRLCAHGNAMLALGLALTALTFYLLLQDSRGFAVTLYGYPMLAMSFSALIVAAVSETSWLRVWRVPGAASLALWSYAIYLTHKGLFKLVTDMLTERAIPTDTWQVALGLSLGSIVLGFVLFRLVETPFMQLRARLVPSNLAPRSQPGEGAAMGSLQ